MSRCLTAAIALFISVGCSSPPPDDPLLDLEPCRLTGGSGLRSVAAECGFLEVPENPQDPDGRTIGLKVARIAAIAPRFPDSAFTVLAGGPGQASTEFYADYAAAFAAIQRHHDILLIDQRGTGGSNALDCEFDLNSGLELSVELARQVAAQCLAALDGDPRYYTTSVAVTDLDRVRAALGYDRLNIYGASYGTRVALHYLRRYPAHTRSVVLDGVIAADQLVGPDIAVDAQAALDAIFARCAADTACAARFGNPAESFAALRQRLLQQPIDLSIPHPLTGAPEAVSLNHDALAGAVRLLSYAPATAALLPLLLDQAQQADNPQPLAAQALMTIASVADALNEGMHNAVVCTEDVPYFSVSAAHRNALADTYLGEMLIDTLAAVCDVWPAGLIDDDFHTPVVSDKPVLLLSGTVDPVTPPRNAERAAATLSDSLHIVAEGHGHGVIAVNCVPGIVADFVSRASVSGLDTTCLSSVSPDPFFLEFTGPGP
ncbi:MAG: alpha/beta fold hydrolase [Gammaproteobacteria bacterium]|nr:alpha/beta fold hydrolase [Gammaproteobacteria bacterium]